MTTKSEITVRKHWLAKRLPFFYGWAIIPISILGVLATSPGQTFMVSVFNPSFRETLNISLTQLTGAYMVGTILASLPQTYVGLWIDRLGIRKMLIIVVSLFSLACLFVSQVRSFAMLFIAFFLLRLLGQGALELVSSNMLPMWFRKKLGSITGFAGVATSLLVGVVPVIVLKGIQTFGWRSTYILAGGLVSLVMLPIAFFFFINRPEDIQQQLDGAAPEENQEEDARQFGKNSFTLKQALRTRSFWVVTILVMSWAAISTGITFNLLPIFTGKGLTETQAAATFTTLMAVAAATRILGGFLADRIPLFWLAVGGQFFYAAGIGAILFLPAGWLVPGYVLLVGLAQGFFSGLHNTVWVRYFGRANLGKIRGIVAAAGVAGSSVGPFLLGVAYDNFGDFNLALAGCAVYILALGIASFWATPPKPQTQS